jgi:hypothetical protein
VEQGSRKNKDKLGWLVVKIPNISNSFFSLAVVAKKYCNNLDQVIDCAVQLICGKKDFWCWENV